MTIRRASRLTSLFLYAPIGIWRLSWAAIKHAWHGHQERTLEERLQVLTTCVNCHKYDKETEACWKCGCSVEEKSRMKTEHCPLHYW